MFKDLDRGSLKTRLSKTKLKADQWLVFQAIWILIKEGYLSWPRIPFRDWKSRKVKQPLNGLQLMETRISTRWREKRDEEISGDKKMRLKQLEKVLFWDRLRRAKPPETLEALLYRSSKRDLHQSNIGMNHPSKTTLVVHRGLKLSRLILAHLIQQDQQINISHPLHSLLVPTLGKTPDRTIVLLRLQSHQSTHLTWLLISRIAVMLATLVNHQSVKRKLTTQA